MAICEIDCTGGLVVIPVEKGVQDWEIIAGSVECVVGEGGETLASLSRAR